MVGNAALYIEIGEAEAAIGCLEKAVKLKPREVQNYIDIASIYGELNEFERAVTILEQGYKKTKNEELAEEIPNYPASRVLLYFDLAYDLDGRVSAVTYDGEVLVSLEYTDGYCTAIIAETDYEGIFSDGDSMTFVYDEQNRISQINYAGDTISYTYNFDGSSSAILPQYETWFQFNDKGMMIGVSGPGGNDNFTVSTENGQIESIESDGFYCEFSYSEAKLSGATERYTDQTVYNKVKYYYENVDGIEYLTKIVSIDESSKTTELIISYDENGNIVSVDHGNGTIYSFAYSDENQMTSFCITSDGVFAIYEIKYDYFGRAIGWNKVC